MAYKPYKMKGHTLPGIKQSPAKQKSPAKCPLIAALPAITGAIGAIGSLKKKKEEQ